MQGKGTKKIRILNEEKDAPKERLQYQLYKNYY
ncbi:hypothetical protein SAMN05421765_2424 [Kaistella antarctica]|nr:hypothetical protein SAMN05421765_2424 [Kaistella antarctica]